MFKIPKFTVRWSAFPVKKTSYLLVQLAGFGAVLDGVAHWSRPGALILGGIVAVLAIERQPDS